MTAIYFLLFTGGFVIGVAMMVLVVILVIKSIRRTDAAHRFDWAIGPVTNKPAQREKP